MRRVLRFVPYVFEVYLLFNKSLDLLNLGTEFVHNVNIMAMAFNERPAREPMLIRYKNALFSVCSEVLFVCQKPKLISEQ